MPEVWSDGGLEWNKESQYIGRRKVGDTTLKRNREKTQVNRKANI